MDRKRQGDVGVASAIFHYTKLGYTVCAPLTDAARYDLVVDVPGEGLIRVQCKSTGHLVSPEVYEVGLRTLGGNQSWSHEPKHISSLECDVVYVYCMDGSSYVFPASVAEGKSSIRLGKKQLEYKVTEHALLAQK